MGTSRAGFAAIFFLAAVGCGPRNGPGGPAPRLLASGPSGEDLPDRPLSGTDHLRLAEAHQRVAQWGAALFHFRMAHQLTLSPTLRLGLEDRIRHCLAKGGLAPPATTPAAPTGSDLAASLSPKVLIAGGVFVLGSPTAERWLATALCEHRSGAGASGRASCVSPSKGDRPVTTASLPPYELDRVEVSWERFQTCVRARVCKAPPARFAAPSDRRLPVVGVTQAEADRYCRFVGARLPTDSEWERAARGYHAPARTWPWGRHAVEGCARHGLPTGAPHPEGPAPVGTNLCDVSLEGVGDLAGNVREWAQPVPPPSPAGGGTATVSDPGARDSNLRPVRGGSFRLPEWRGLAGAHAHVRSDHRADDLGFRCAWNVGSAAGTTGRAAAGPRDP